MGPFIPCTPWIPGDPDGPLIEYEKSHQAKQHQLYINKHTCTNKQKKEGGRREWKGGSGRREGGREGKREEGRKKGIVYFFHLTWPEIV